MLLVAKEQTYVYTIQMMYFVNQSSLKLLIINSTIGYLHSVACIFIITLIPHISVMYVFV